MLSSQMRRKERTKLRGSTRHPEVGKVISDGDGERGAMPVLLPAHRRPVGCREWVFPVRRSGRPRWLPTLSAGRHRIGQYVHLQQCARLAVLALRVGDPIAAWDAHSVRVVINAGRRFTNKNHR